MNRIISVAAALGLVAAPALPLSTANACGPRQVCYRPAAPRGPVFVPGVNGPGPQGPGGDHDGHDHGNNGPNQQGNNNGPNQQGNNQNGNNQFGNNQNGNNQNGNNQSGNNQNANNQNGNNQNQNTARNQQNQNQNQNQNTTQNQNQNQNQNTTQNQQQNQNTNQNQNQQQTQTVAIPAGSRITLPGNFGSQMGTVYLVINGIKLPMVVEQWNESGITLTLPVMQLTAAQQVKLEIVKSDNTQLASMDITLNPTPKVIVLDKPTVVPAQTADVAPDRPTNG